MSDLAHDCPCCGGWIADEQAFVECEHCGATYAERAAETTSNDGGP